MYKVLSINCLYPDMIKDYKQAKNNLYAVYLSCDYQVCHKRGKSKMIAINLEAENCPAIYDPTSVHDYVFQSLESISKLKKQSVKKKRKTKKNPNPPNDKPLLGNLVYYSHKVLKRNNKKFIQVLATTDDLENEMIFNSELK